MKFPFHTSKDVYLDALYIESITNNFLKIVFYHNNKLHYTFTSLRNIELNTKDLLDYINNCIHENTIIKGKIYSLKGFIPIKEPKIEYQNTFPKKEIKTYELEIICPNTNKKIIQTFKDDSFELI